MKKIGQEVSFLAPKENNPRNGEGDFLRLRDGTILYVYSGFVGACGSDDAASDIRGIRSTDEGKTWVEDRIVFLMNQLFA